jgi:hypothetical protein
VAANGRRRYIYVRVQQLFMMYLWWKLNDGSIWRARQAYPSKQAQRKVRNEITKDKG